MERSEKEILKALAMGYDVVSTATKPVRKEVGDIAKFYLATEGRKVLLKFLPRLR
jgi:hypothetical protein